MRNKVSIQGGNFFRRICDFRRRDRIVEILHRRNIVFFYLLAYLFYQFFTNSVWLRVDIHCFDFLVNKYFNWKKFRIESKNRNESRSEKTFIFEQ